MVLQHYRLIFLAVVAEIIIYHSVNLSDFILCEGRGCAQICRLYSVL
jgi:hypothetical protein